MFRVGILIALLLMLCGCAFQRAQEAADARAQIVGLTKEQVFTCMGIPPQKAKEGAVEVWTYLSGNDQVARLEMPLRRRAATGRLCTVSIAFQQERVSRVNYVGQTDDHGV